MNVGQVLEVHFGWAGLQLGKRIQEWADEKGFTTEGLRKKLLTVFSKPATKKFVEGLSAEDWLSLRATSRTACSLQRPSSTVRTKTRSRRRWLSRARRPRSNSLV